MSEAKARLDEPGFLRGRQRSPAYKADVLAAVAWIARFHGLATYKHSFKLIRQGVAALIGIASHTMQRVIRTLLDLGFLVRKGELRRWKDISADERARMPTKRSLTPGSTDLWYLPIDYDIGPEFKALFPEQKTWESDAPEDVEDGTELAAPPLENQCAPKEIPKVRGRFSRVESRKEKVSRSPQFRSALNSEMSDEAPIDAVDISPGVDPVIWEATRHLREAVEKPTLSPQALKPPGQYPSF